MCLCLAAESKEDFTVYKYARLIMWVTFSRMYVSSSAWLGKGTHIYSTASMQFA